jgi:membrane protease subunit (stomatin/prohibitin family)
MTAQRKNEMTMTTLQEAKTAKTEAENAIREALDKFIEATGMTVADVRVDTITLGRTSANPTQMVNAVRLVVRL